MNKAYAKMVADYDSAIEKAKEEHRCLFLANDSETPEEKQAWEKVISLREKRNAFIKRISE